MCVHSVAVSPGLIQRWTGNNFWHHAGNKVLFTYQADVYSDLVADLNCRLVFYWGLTLGWRIVRQNLIEQRKSRCGSVWRHIGGPFADWMAMRVFSCLVALFDMEEAANRIISSAVRYSFHCYTLEAAADTVSANCTNFLAEMSNHNWAPVS